MAAPASSRSGTIFRAFPPRGNCGESQLVRLALENDDAGHLFENFATSSPSAFKVRVVFDDRPAIELPYIAESERAVHVLVPPVDLSKETNSTIMMMDRRDPSKILKWAYTFTADDCAWQEQAVYTMKELNILLQSLLDIDEEEMKTIAARHYTKEFNESKQECAAPPIPMYDKNASVLIVEDDLTTRLFVMQQARHAGHNALGAADGKEALEVIKKEMVNIIFMDVGLPDIAGHDLTKLLLSAAQCRDPQHPPVIIAFSASDSPTQIADCIKAGCVDYVVKPMNNQEMELRIRFAMTQKAFLTTKLVAVAHLLNRHHPTQLLAIREQLLGSCSSAEYAELALQDDLPLVWLFFNQLRMYSPSWGALALETLSAMPGPEQLGKPPAVAAAGGGTEEEEADTSETAMETE